MAFLGLVPSASPNSDLTLVVQPVIAGSATVSSSFLNNEEQFAETIFSQIGLTVDFLGSISAPGVPTSYSGTNPNEESLYFGDSSFQSAPVLTVWFVNTITNNGGSDRGLSQQDGVDFGSWIATTGSAEAVNDTLAHEIANILTDLHEITGSPNNLLEVGTDRNIPSSVSQVFPGSNYDQITSAQESFMLGNTEFVQNVVTPEPGTLVLAAIGVSIFAGVRRFRARREFRD